MPDVLNALVAFVAEHQRCGDLISAAWRVIRRQWKVADPSRRIGQPVGQVAELDEHPG